MNTRFSRAAGKELEIYTLGSSLHVNDVPFIASLSTPACNVSPGRCMLSIAIKVLCLGTRQQEPRRKTRGRSKFQNSTTYQTTTSLVFLRVIVTVITCRMDISLIL
jgi:hypothetical protein